MKDRYEPVLFSEYDDAVRAEITWLDSIRLEEGSEALAY